MTEQVFSEKPCLACGLLHGDTSDMFMGAKSPHGVEPVRYYVVVAHPFKEKPAYEDLRARVERLAEEFKTGAAWNEGPDGEGVSDMVARRLREILGEGSPAKGGRA